MPLQCWRAARSDFRNLQKRKLWRKMITIGDLLASPACLLKQIMRESVNIIVRISFCSLASLQNHHEYLSNRGFGGFAFSPLKTGSDHDDYKQRKHENLFH